MRGIQRCQAVKRAGHLSLPDTQRAAPALALAILVGSALASALPNPAVRSPVEAQAAAARSVWDGVYTDEQSKRGETVSKTACLACHGESLSGGDLAASLVGNDFLANWNDK